MELSPDRSIRQGKALWVRLTESATESDCLKLVKNRYNTTVAKGLEDAARQLAQDPPFLLFLEINHDLAKASEILCWINQSHPDVSTLIVTEELKITSLKKLINQHEIISIINHGIDSGMLVGILEGAEQLGKEGVRNKRLLSEFKYQNQQLEEMTKNLEKLVRDRTQDIEFSRSETERKLKKVRSLIKFIKDLAIVATIDDLMNLLRIELKRFHQVGEPFLACQTANYGKWILHYRTGRILERPTQSSWATGLRIRINSKIDQLYLANEFSRPFQKVIAVPLHTKGGNTSLATLFIEHALEKDRVDEFIGFIGERLQTMSLALDRLLLDIELKRSSYLWECTFDSIGDPIAIFDESLCVIRSNKKFMSVFGQEIVTTDIQLLDQKTNPVKNCLQTRKATVVSCKFNERYYDWHCYPIIFRDSQTATSVVSHFVDVTIHKQLQSQLIHNEKMSAIGHLAGNIAHELNNPLTGIRSLAQVLISELPVDNPLVQDLKEVEAGAERSQKIIINLLEFSKEGGERQVQKVNLNEVIERTLPLLKSITSEHTRNITLSEEPLFVMAEPNLLQQVVFNLVNNACQSMDCKGELTVATKKVRLKDEWWTRLQVQDTGHGIKQSLLSTIFDPFFTTKSLKGGTGLGLSMSKNVIDGFGGRIEVESEEGLGTTFYVYLRIVSSD